MNNKQKHWGIFSSIGSSAHAQEKREVNDFYSTNPISIQLLDKHNLLDKDVPYFETACGNGKMAKELLRLGYNVTKAIDLFDRGYGDVGIDFFDIDEVFQGNTITNPPYKHIDNWILHSLKITSNKVYIFCRIQTIETVSRYTKIFKNNPPVYICPFVRRVKCYKNDDVSYRSSAVCYAWFIWDNTIDNKETKIIWLI